MRRLVHGTAFACGVDMLKRSKTLRTLLLSAGPAFLLLFSSACGSSSESTCPFYLVTPEAGVTGFSSVGEWRTDAVCAQYCQNDYPVCQLSTPNTVKCQKGCA
jgi:hypothetical protein